MFVLAYIKPKNLGKNKLIAGIKVTKRRIIIKTANIGRSLEKTSSIFISERLHPTNKALPTGGVHKPIQRLKVMMIPK